MLVFECFENRLAKRTDRILADFTRAYKGNETYAKLKLLKIYAVFPENSVMKFSIPIFN